MIDNLTKRFMRLQVGSLLGEWCYIKMSIINSDFKVTKNDLSLYRIASVHLALTQYSTQKK